MKVSNKNIDEIFTFKGEWDVESRCGLEIEHREGYSVIIVTELYLDNPGSSVTSVAPSLAMQICAAYNIDLHKVIYIEHNPDMSSKLKFYDENYYLVSFDIKENVLANPKWKKLTEEEIKQYV